MPTAILDSCRQRASTLVTQLRTDRYRYEVGLTSELNRRNLLREQSDLFTINSLAELRHAYDGINGAFQTEKAAAKRLINFAQWGAITLAEDTLTSDMSREPPEEIKDRIFKLRDDIARQLGFSTFLELKSDEYGVDHHALEVHSREFLERTEMMRSTDVGILRPIDRMVDLGHTYQTLFAGLGFNTAQQTNVEIDLEPASRKRRRVFCAALKVPDEIKLVLNPQEDWSDVELLLGVAGRVQQFAWTSRNLPPELRLYGDRSIEYGWAFVFSSLFSTREWLEETYGFAENSAITRVAAVNELTNARQDAEGSMREDSRYRSAERMRGRAFSTQMIEHLRSRFGSAWWRSRKAGDMLIDLWNTGYRYTADELASMIGLGELSFEWLASKMVKLVREGK
jgi:hypothetical protein